MNLDELLDVTEPVTVQFMEHEITAHVYTAGRNRMTKEDRDVWSATTSNGTDAVIQMRAVLPILIKGWDIDGEPIVYKDKTFPENVALCPDALLVAVADPVLAHWNAQNPTLGVDTRDGSVPEEKLEQSLVASTTP